MKNVDQMSLSELRAWYLSQGMASTGIDALIRAAKREHQTAIVAAVNAVLAVQGALDTPGDLVALRIIGAVNEEGEKLG